MVTRDAPVHIEWSAHALLDVTNPLLSCRLATGSKLTDLSSLFAVVVPGNTADRSRPILCEASGLPRCKGCKGSSCASC